MDDGRKCSLIPETINMTNYEPDEFRFLNTLQISRIVKLAWTFGFVSSTVLFGYFLLCS